MANTYNWIITNMDCYPTYESQTDVVYHVYYYVEAFSSETYEVTQADGTITKNPYQATISGEQDITYVAGSPYTPYSQLTNAIVVEWIQTTLGTDGVNAIQTKLDTMITNEINPSIINPPLPWITPTTNTTT